MVIMNVGSIRGLATASAGAMTKVKDFAVTGRKIVCVGRNYVEHVKELNNEMPSLEEPIIFLKPPSSYLPVGTGPIRLPKGAEVHHEVELGLVIGKGGADIRQEDALSHVGGYCLALDLTARNIQDKAKKKGHPWTVAKGYDTFTPVSGLIEENAIPAHDNVRLWCRVGNEMRQDGNTRDMIYKLPFLISYISGIMSLEPGDVILTGTPKGVGPLKAGQVIECGLGDAEAPICDFKFEIVDR